MGYERRREKGWEIKGRPKRGRMEEKGIEGGEKILETRNFWTSNLTTGSTSYVDDI